MFSFIKPFCCQYFIGIPCRENEFENLELPSKNVVSILMDFCNVMQGFEPKVQENLASHLLDIDGDSCHHVHNIAKCFTKPFENFLESLFSNILTDFYYSSDSRNIG